MKTAYLKTTLTLASALVLGSPWSGSGAADPPALEVHRAVELAWPSTAGQQYRLYRSVDDFEHFYPLGDPVSGTGAAIQLFDSTRGTQRAFYKLHVVPPSLSANALVALHEAFRTVVNGHNVDGIAALFQPDMVFDEVAQPVRRNRQDLKDWFTLVFTLWPDYADSDGVVLTGENLLVVEHVGVGTHSAEWDLGPLGKVPPSGKTTLIPHVDLFEFEGDKVFRFSVYSEYLGLLVQVGAVPPPTPPVLVPSITLPTPTPTGLAPLAAVAEARTRWNAHDLARYMGLVQTDADLLYVVLGTPLTRAQFGGLAELYWLAFPDVQSRAVNTRDLGGGWVISECVWAGKNTGPFFGAPASGRPFQLRTLELSRVSAEGLITYSHVYFDNVTLMGQLGLLGR